MAHDYAGVRFDLTGYFEDVTVTGCTTEWMVHSLQMVVHCDPTVDNCGNGSEGNSRENVLRCNYYKYNIDFLIKIVIFLNLKIYNCFGYHGKKI